MKQLSLLISLIFFLNQLGNSQQVTAKFCVDNCYAAYIGNANGVIDKIIPVGSSDGVVNSTEAMIYQHTNVTVNYNYHDWIYVVAWSDNIGCQGLIGEFTGNRTVYTGDVGWEVYATGISTNMTDLAPNYLNINLQILQANASNGWQQPAVGAQNGNNSSICQYYDNHIPGISNNARWIWHNSNNSSNAFIGFDHNEYLIFRFPAHLVYESPKTTSCKGNLISNPNFDSMGAGWSNINTGSSTVNFWDENTALQSTPPNDWIPEPKSGNYMAMWISNVEVNGTDVKREGAFTKLINSIPPNSGTYRLSFDYCCLGYCGLVQSNIGNHPPPNEMPQIGLYAVRNPSNSNPISIQESHVPSNNDLFGPGNVHALSEFSIDPNCGDEPYVTWQGQYVIDERSIKYHYEMTFNSSTLPFKMTHLMITHSNAIITNGYSQNFMGMDNFCLTKVKGGTKPHTTPIKSKVQTIKTKKSRRG